jgi:hypothetical protein
MFPFGASVPQAATPLFVPHERNQAQLDLPERRVPHNLAGALLTVRYWLHPAAWIRLHPAVRGFGPQCLLQFRPARTLKLYHDFGSQRPDAPSSVRDPERKATGPLDCNSRVWCEGDFVTNSGVVHLVAGPQPWLNFRLADVQPSGTQLNAKEW